MKEDIIWLDYARVIGIFLVILGHVEQHFPSFLITDLVLKDVWHIIYLFHMPLFLLFLVICLVERKMIGYHSLLYMGI